MKPAKTALGSGIILILLTTLFISIAYAQGELGATGLADSPTGGLETQYMFTGMYSKNQQYATVVHCTNISSEPNEVYAKVEFFPYVGGFAASAASIQIEPSQTKSWATRPVTGLSLIVPNDPIEIDNYGSGRVLATPGSQLICTVQLLTLNSSNIPTDITKLHLFNANGNLIDGPSMSPGASGDIFLPLIFKN